MKHKIDIKSAPVKAATYTLKQTVYVDGKEVFSGEYWPDSKSSCDAHDRAMMAALDRTGLTPDEIDAAFMSI